MLKISSNAANDILQFACVLDSPVGKLGVTLQNNQITTLDFLATSFATHVDDHAVQVAQQINTYFTDPQHSFTLPLAAAGTPFQQRVWKALCEIPAGTTLTYGALAKKLNSSPRAVGQACRRNPIPIIVPCHRVVGASQLGGYAGDTGGGLFAIKQWLLRFEMG